MLLFMDLELSLECREKRSFVRAKRAQNSTGRYPEQKSWDCAVIRSFPFEQEGSGREFERVPVNGVVNVP